MKNKPESRRVGLFKKIFNVRTWVDWDRTKTAAGYLKHSINIFFFIQPKEKAEPFDEAMVRFNLTEDELLNQKKGLYRLSLIMVGVAFLLFLYAISQFVYGSWMSIVLSFVLVSLALVFAFRYHFWYFQIEQRRLGFTLSEWFNQGLLGRRK